MILVSHPTGNTFVRALLTGLLERGELESFHTTISMGGFPRILPVTFMETLSRRSFPLPDAMIHISPWRELVRLLAPKLGLTRLLRHETGWASIDAVCRELDRNVAQRLSRFAGSTAGAQRCLSGVYAYEDCALETFRAAKLLGLSCFYDLPIVYWETSRRLLEIEALRRPEWEPTLGGTRDSQEKLARKTEELNLADVVVCPSQFVYDSLPPVARQSKTCTVAEFGSPELSEMSEDVIGNSGNRLRLLFVGSMTQRKGLADLFQAVKSLKRSDVELVIMGSAVVPMEFYRSQYKNFTYEPPRPHLQVLRLMRSCDVFVLPSIVEGRALVQQEAMICGLPLIVTPNAGGADLIEEGRTGFLVPAGAPDVLAENISWFADHRNEAREMGKLARQKAAGISWDSYRRKIFEAILPAARG